MKYTDGYEVDKDELIKAYVFIDGYLDSTFGRDQDSDSNVEFILVDRQRHEPMHFQPVPYLKYDKVKDEYENEKEYLEALLFNLRIASENLQTFLRVTRKV